MTDDEINVAIAEVHLGVTISADSGGFDDDGNLWYWADWDTPTERRITVLNYCGDLNAMFKAEEVLTDDEWMEYENFIYEITLRDSAKGVCRHMHATARQQAEAFLRAVGKWKGEA